MAVMTQQDIAKTSLQPPPQDDVPRQWRKWVETLSAEEQQKLAAAPRENVKNIVAALLERHPFRENSEQRNLAQEQLLLKQLEDMPDRLMAMMKDVAGKQKIMSENIAKEQERNIFQKLQRAITEVLQKVPFVDKLINPLQQQQQQQLAENRQPDKQPQQTPADKAAEGQKKDQVVQDKEKDQRIARARARKRGEIDAASAKNQLGAAPKSARAPRGGRGGRGSKQAEETQTLQPDTELQAENQYSSLTQDVINKGIEAGRNAQAQLAADGHEFAAVPSTPLARNNQNVTKNTPGGGGPAVA